MKILYGVVFENRKRMARPLGWPSQYENLDVMDHYFAPSSDRPKFLREHVSKLGDVNALPEGG